MGSAPAAGSFESRLGSSARRGAYVGQGVPGVYRVTRSRVTQAQSAPRSTGTPVVWIQPDDQIENTYGPGYTAAVQASGSVDSPDYPAEVIATCNRLRSIPTPSLGTTGANIQGSSIPSATQTFFTISEPYLTLAPFEPDVGDWPPGATGVEQESARGVLLSLRLYGLMYIESPFDPTLRRVDEGLYTAATNPLPRYYTPSELGGMVVQATTTDPGVGAFPEWTTDLAVTLDSNDCAVFVVGLDPQISASWTDEDFGFIHVSDVGAARVKFEATYRPPRYRFTF